MFSCPSFSKACVFNSYLVAYPLRGPKNRGAAAVAAVYTGAAAGARIIYSSAFLSVYSWGKKALDNSMWFILPYGLITPIAAAGLLFLFTQGALCGFPLLHGAGDRGVRMCEK